MSTYYERNIDEIKDLTWEEAFRQLAHEVLNDKPINAYDFIRNYIRGKGYVIRGEEIIKDE